MRVAVTGASGVLGRSAVAALSDAGHDVLAVARSEASAARAAEVTDEVAIARWDDVGSLTTALEGCDAVCNLATHVPVGITAAFDRAWRQHDLLRRRGAAAVAAAARAAGVRRLVQESVSHLYADGGDGWVTETHPLGITLRVEPACMAEAAVAEFACESYVGVALRFGLVVGDDDMTRWALRASAQGRPVGFGDPDGWVHVVHTDDLGTAVRAALRAPTGVYNVGAEPTRRRDLVDGYARAVGHRQGQFAGAMARRMAGPRMEPLTRSLRVSSEAFTAATGWVPARARFDATWFDVALAGASSSVGESGHAHA